MCSTISSEFRNLLTQPLQNSILHKKAMIRELSVLVLCGLATPSAGEGVFQSTYLAFDCSSQFHILPDHKVGVIADLGAYSYLANDIMVKMKERARCTCPTVTEQELSDHFDTFDVMMRAFFTDETTEIHPCLDTFLRTVSPLTMVTRSEIRAKFKFSATTNTCDYFTTGRCNFQAPFPELDKTYSVAVHKCPSGNPSFSVTCVGDGCSFFKECDGDASCPTGQSCLTFGKSFAEDNFENTYTGLMYRMYEGAAAERLTTAKAMMTKLGKSMMLFATEEEEKEYGGVDDLIQRVLRDFIGTDSNKFCVKNPVADTAANIAFASRMSIRNNTVTECLVEKSWTEYNVTVDNWDGMFPNGESAAFNLIAGRYGRMQRMPFVSGLFSAFTCDDEYLSDQISMRFRGLNKLIDSIARGYKDEWFKRGIEREVFPRVMEFYTPEFFLTYFSDFTEKLWGNSAPVASVKTLLESFFSGGSEKEVSSGETEGGKYPTLDTFGWKYWQQNHHLAATIDLQAMSFPGTEFHFWADRCSVYPDGLPELSMQFAGPIAQALNGEKPCKSDADCTGDASCYTLEQYMLKLRQIYFLTQGLTTSLELPQDHEKIDMIADYMWSTKEYPYCDAGVMKNTSQEAKETIESCKRSDGWDAIAGLGENTKTIEQMLITNYVMKSVRDGKTTKACYADMAHSADIGASQNLVVWFYLLLWG